MRGANDSNDTHQFQTCVDLIRGCKAFRHRLELDNRDRRLPRWRFRLYIAIIILLEFLFVIISVLLAPQIICGAIQRTEQTCRKHVKGAQALMGIYSTIFFVWGIAVAVLIYSMCRRRRQDVDKDRFRRTRKEEVSGIASNSPGQRQRVFDQRTQPSISTLRSSTQTSSHGSEEAQQQRQLGVTTREPVVSRQAQGTGMSVQPYPIDEHERQNSGDLGTHPMIEVGPAMPTRGPTPAPPPYSALNVRGSETTFSVAGSQITINPERSQLDDREIQRMFHSRMYSSRPGIRPGRPSL